MTGCKRSNGFLAHELIHGLKKTLIACLLASAALPLSAAGKKKYDERGNPITETKAATAAPAAAEGPAAQPAIETAQSDGNAKPNEAAAKPVNAPADNTQALEEAQAAAQQRAPLTKVYLENAQLYLRSARNDKALEFFKKSQEAGEDAFSREARLMALGLRARRGDQGLETEAEGVDEKLRLAALLRIADGYYACARELVAVQGGTGVDRSQGGDPGGRLKKPECLNEAERMYALVGETAPRSAEGRLARLRLGLLLVDNGRLEAALPHLTTTLLLEQNSPLSTGQEIPFDRAFFNLAQLYERPWYHQDVHKARAAYRQVLKYKRSPYHAAARERIAQLERFGTGYGSP